MPSLKITRKSAAMLLCFFCLHAFEGIPLSWAMRQPPSTCCGRSICLCTHPKGAACPFKTKHEKTVQKSQAAQPAPGQKCHLHAQKKQMPQNPAALWIQKAPCHKDTPKSLLPGAPTDYEFSSAVHLSFRWSRSLVFSSAEIFPSFPTLKILDPPPRFLF